MIEWWILIMSGPDGSFCFWWCLPHIGMFWWKNVRKGNFLMHYGVGAVLLVLVGTNGRSAEINTDCQEWFFTHKRVRFECDQCDIIESWVRKLEASQKLYSRLHFGDGGWWAGMGVWQKSIHVPCCQGAVLILVCFRSPDWVYPLNWALLLGTALWKLVKWTHRSSVRLRRYSQAWSRGV